MNRKERRHQQTLGRRAGAPGPDPAAAAFAQAGAAFQAGRLAESETLLRQTLRFEPDHADAHHWLGVVLGQKGDSRGALQHLRKAASLKPGSADYLNNLGIAELDQGNLDAARRSFEQAVKLNPRLAAAHHNLGLVFKKGGEWDAAIACFERAIALVPNYVNAHLNLGNALQDSGRIDEAIAHFRRLTAIAPNSREAYLNLAGALRAAQRLDEAVAAAQKAVALDPAFIEAGNLLAGLYWSLDRGGEAEAETRRILSREPGNLEALNRLGKILIIRGRFDEATTIFQSALAIEPDEPEANFGITHASKAYSTPEMADRVEQLLAANTGNEQRSVLHFTLGKIYDDMGDYDRAFVNYRGANDLAVPDAWFDAKIWTAFVDRMIAVFTPEFFAGHKGFGSSSPRPVFIVGMPRSGTTLTEQIIASHPLVAAGGEMTAIPRLADKLPDRLGVQEKFPECAADITREQTQEAAAAYLGELDKIDAAADRVTDKMPMNFQNLGLIALLFPNATYIHCRRDPIDTCLSCYFQRFGYHLDFSLSFENLAAYYRGYLRLMDHWRRVLPVKMLEVDYEETIADQEGMSRRLIAHCGLEWDDRCLQFHKTDRAVKTASVWQVRQPIYKTSVERWRRYERHLGPLIRALEDAGAA